MQWKVSSIQNILTKNNLYGATIISTQIRAISRLPCKLLLTTYLMDHQYNTMNEFLGENYSEHFPGITQEGPIGKQHQEINHHQDLISPAGIPCLHLNSPTPLLLKNNHILLSPYDEQYSHDHDRQDGLSVSPRKPQMIKNALSFDDDSPKKTNYANFQVGTAESVKMANRNMQIKEDKKNSKGLRNLSESVYKIVLQRTITTYKEVADHLVKMLNEGQFGPLEMDGPKNKDEQNIKRRVYDALNVLISADVLKKNGKHVMSREDAFGEKVKSSSRYGKKQDKDNLLEQIRRKQIVISEKRDKIEQLNNKKQLLNAILKRNKKKKILQKQKIIFPLVGITYSKQLPDLQYENNRSKVLVPLKTCLQLIGDMDLLVKAGIDVLNQNIEQIMEEVNIQDVQKEQIPKKKSKPEMGLPQKPKNTRVLYSL